MSDILEIKRRLASRAASVAEMLLPAGIREGHEWRAGSANGEKGRSLAVHLDGAKAGLWSDFADGKGGDLIDLWSAAKGMTLSEAIDDARSWLGIEKPEFVRPAKRSYTRPPKPRCTKPEHRVRDYLTEDRNIPEHVLEAYRIGEDGDDIVFPFLLPDGTLAMAKKRPAFDGGRPKPTAKDCEPVLFGWQAIPDYAREVVITEGEIDALSMAAYGHPAMSVPFGGGGGAKQQWIESDYDRLDRFERIYLALDMDEPGEQAVVEIAQRLGRHRCLRVNLPRKDANQCLVDGITGDEIAAAIASASHLDPDGLRRPSDYGDDVVTLFWPKDGEHVGYSTPYGKLGRKLLFRPAEVTIWTGDSGSGKSQILSDCSVEWVKQGSRICLSSLEMKPQQSLKRMVKQVVGLDRPSERGVRAALTWLDDGMLIYELTGKAKVDALLEVFNYARAKYGCDQFIIDSLMRLGIAGDDYNSQEAAIFAMVEWAVSSGVHLHLVAHAKKGDRDRGSPETADIKGAMEVGANAFNIVSVWRNRRHEEDLKAAVGDEEATAKLMEKPGVIMNIAKQRNGDFEGKVGLWFDQATYRYQSSHDRSAWSRTYLAHDWADPGEWAA